MPECLRGNSIDIGFWEAEPKLIKARSKWNASDPSDPRDCKNPVITMDPMRRDPND